MDDSLDREAVGELEREHGLHQLSGEHALDVLLHRHLIGHLVVAGQAPTDHDALQVQPLAQRLALFVDPPPDPHAAVLGVHDHLDAVERVALGVVVFDEVVARHVGVDVALAVLVDVHDEAERARDQPAVHLDAELAVGKAADDGREFGARPRLHAGKAEAVHLENGGVVGDGKRADAERGLERVEVDFGHRRGG